MTLFDTSAIIDARDSRSPWHRWAQERIADAVLGEGAAVNTIVLSEASVRAHDPENVPSLLKTLGISLIPLPLSAALPAAAAFRIYLDRLKSEGKIPMNRIPLPDFLIGAHALAENLPLVTRDPDRIRTYFPNVKVVAP